MSEETPENGPPMPIHKRQKKKRKNFLMNAKKYAKKGQMGRGSQIPDELYQYFVGILEAMKKGIEDEEERASLVTNVMERTKEKELDIIGNQLGCRVIELLLPHASPDDLERFMEIVTPDLRKLCASDFSSHVVETVLKVACDRATNHLQETEDGQTENSDEAPAKRPKLETKKKKKYKKEHRNNCHEFTLKICKYALNNLEDFVWDSYANHVLRSALKCLSGITLLPGEKPKINLFIIKNDKPKGIPPHETTINYKVVPDEFKEVVIEFANRLSAWPQFHDLPYKNLTSGLLQVLLYATNNVDKKLTKNLVTRLLDESFAGANPADWVSNEADDEKKEDNKDFKDEETLKDGNMVENSWLPPVFKSEAAVRLLEASLFVSKKKTYTQLYARCFINRLGQLSAMPMLNFTVQRLVDNCRVKEEFEAMLSELSGSFGGILASGNTGVLLALAKAALRLRSGQAAFINNLEALLECNTPESQNHFPLACLQLKPASSWEPTKLDKLFIPVHGAVMLQTLLQFQRPGKALAGLLELDPEMLCRIFSDAKGCHVADVVCSSATLGAKSRDKVINRLKGFYQKLALDQYGSRAFEHIFKAAPLEQKLRIMTELAHKSSLLNSSMYGRLIADKYQLSLFTKSQDSWKKTVLNIDKA